MAFLFYNQNETQSHYTSSNKHYINYNQNEAQNYYSHLNNDLNNNKNIAQNPSTNSNNVSNNQYNLNEPQNQYTKINMVNNQYNQNKIQNPFINSNIPNNNKEARNLLINTNNPNNNQFSNKINQYKKQNLILNNPNNNYKPKGLLNLNLNCYMNSLLQCLYYIKEFREYFINNVENFKEDKPVCKALAKVMNGLKNENDKFYDAKDLKEIM